MDKYEFLAGLGLPPATVAVMKANEAGRGPAPGGSGRAPSNSAPVSAGNSASTLPQPKAALNGPMLPDCKPIKGKVPGPAHHLLCATHGHVLDVKNEKIIALSLEQYKANAGGGPKMPKADAKPKADAVGSTAAAAASTTAEGPKTAAQAASVTAASDETAKAREEVKKVIKLLQIEQEDFASTFNIYADFEKENEDGILKRGVAAVSHLLGDAKDPGGALTKLQFELIAEHGAGMKAAAEQNVAEARKHLAAMNAIAEKARKLVLAYTTDVSGAERAVTVLKVADKAGEVATAGLEVLAPAIGKGLSLAKKGGVAAMQVHLGDEVNWAEFGVEVACDIFFDKIGGGELAKRVGGPVTSKLVAKFGTKVSKEFIEKSVEEVVKHEMTTVVKTTAGGIYDAAKGKDITYEEFLSRMIDKMTDPQELLVSMISSKVQIAVKK
jgi:hypothetical protein